ncbi:hydroxymethylbilane synthase [bacterium]|nr:hydroxymethylbilane synthase [bacterium]
MQGRRIKVGTRGSALALWQANWVIRRLCEVAPEVSCDIEIIRTEGDRRQDVPLAAVGLQGVFVAELEAALSEGKVDIAVHSGKDMPSSVPDHLMLGAFMPREDAHDVIVSLKHGSIHDLPDGARIGTGSIRRVSQLKHHNPTWRFEDLRGNLDTRLAKLEHQDLDAIVLAAAGLIRLGWEERITARIPMGVCLPAVSQGAVAVELRADDAELAALVARLDDASTRAAVVAERALLRTMQGGCQAPIGAHGRLFGDHLQLEGVVAAPDGSRLIRRTMEGPMAKAEALGEALGRELMELGGRELLAMRSL